MSIRALKYLLAFLLPLLAWFSFRMEGIWSFSALIYAFVLVPLAEFLVPPDPSNLNEAERELLRKDKLYDLVIYLTVPVQWCMLIYFLWVMEYDTQDHVTAAGRISAMGLLCGVIGINVAHELGHRTTRFEQFLSKCLLITSLYLHFFIEHNQGHHRNVGTEEDPASAKKGENVYAFWFRSVFGSYRSAWEIEAKRLRRKKLSFWSVKNQMLVFTVLQLVVLVLIALLCSWATFIAFMLAAIIGMLLLETVNYIEHYGLRRSKVTEYRYENVQPLHSWNSDHLIGRMILFELSRHSDHHYRAAKPYQELDHMDNSPQMPTGYPGMILTALVPPLWFSIMDPKIVQQKSMIPSDS